MHTDLLALEAFNRERWPSFRSLRARAGFLPYFCQGVAADGRVIRRPYLGKGQIVIGELPVLLFELAFDLVPVALEL
jgi:hypothetical protein